MSKRPSNALRFRSTVEVEGVTYTSQNTFLQKKKKKKNAEQHFAKVEMECHIKEVMRFVIL